MTNLMWSLLLKWQIGRRVSHTDVDICGVTHS